MTLFSIFWSLNIVFSKVLLNNGSDPFVLSFQIFFFAAVILFIYTIIFHKKEYKRLNKNNIVLIAASGLIGSGIGNLASYYGLKLVVL